MQPTNHQPNEQQPNRSCAGSLITTSCAWPQWQITRAEKLERRSPTAEVPNVFEIVVVIGLRLVRFSYFRKWLILATTNQREIATLAGGFFFCVVVDCIISYAIFESGLTDWMNEMKTLDDAVIELNGVLPDYYQYNSHGKYALHASHGVCSVNENDKTRLDFICKAHEFQQRAKELGFVGKYRWGVVYETDGKRPELADDVVVSAESKLYKIGELSDAESAKWNWKVCVKFKITDQRHKPADTSYLDKSKPERETISLNSTEWYDYDNQKALRLPPVGVECEVYGALGQYNEWQKCELMAVHNNTVFVCDKLNWTHRKKEDFKFRPLDHGRKAKAERQKVVDYALDHVNQNLSIREIAAFWYDKGFLRLPD